MSIDLRANITCSLGTLISGNISDEYVQDTGLIKYQGDVELSGIYTPAPGTIVTFSYTKDGVTRTIPRKLRVLSSFADPFRRTTQVRLGCKLTYLQDLKPAPTVAEEETGKRIQCLNGYLEYPVDSPYGVPIKASDMMDVCLLRLDITASTNPLTNVFFRDSFDFTDGYVNVLSGLLVSESYCGYLDIDEVLQVFSLDQSGGTGPVIDQSDIIDLSSIGLGDLPGDSVVIRYDSLKLKDDYDSEIVGSDDYAKRNWELSTTENLIATCYPVNYKLADGISRTSTVCFRTSSRTVSSYGADLSWDPDTCVLSGKEGPDLSDSVIRQRTQRQVIKAGEANGYCSTLLSAGFNPAIGQEGTVTEETRYTYDSMGQVIRQVTKTYEPMFMWAGGLSLQYAWGTYPTGNAVYLGNQDWLVREQIVETQYIYAPIRNSIAGPKEEVVPEVSGTRVKTTTYEHWSKTQQGNNAISYMRENGVFNGADDELTFLNSIADILILVQEEVQMNAGRLIYSTTTRPKPSERQIGSNSTADRTESISELLYATGSPEGLRIVEFSMEYQSDDYYSPTGAIIKGDAAEKALRYGRTKNRILLGNRYGMNIQLAPEKMPDAPFSPIIVQANGLSALYRTNGTNWQFDNQGLLTSTDALFWGAIGGTGDFWFPVSPGIVTLPSEPPIVDGSMTVGTLVPPWNEIVVTIGSVKLSATVTGLPYPLQQLTTINPLAVRIPGDVRRVRLVNTSSIAVSMEALLPSVASGASVAVQAIDVEFSYIPPDISSGFSAEPSAVDFLGIFYGAVYAGNGTVVQIPSEYGDIALSVITPEVVSGGSIEPANYDMIISGLSPYINNIRPLSGTAAPMLGVNAATNTTEWTQIGYTTNDNYFTTSDFGFEFKLGGVNYTYGYVSANGYITFGGGAFSKFSLGATIPALPKLLFLPADNSLRLLYTKAGTYLSTKYFGIRWEGYMNSSTVPPANSFVEIYFYEALANGSQYIEVRYGTIQTTYFLMVANSTTAYASDYTVNANTSWVLTGTDTGNTWIIESNKYILSDQY